MTFLQGSWELLTGFMAEIITENKIIKLKFYDYGSN
ncbi:hypothetical protein BXY82_0471 [Gelidibacter sediminis]|uniref:Uncharacterized protein n=1 Tax=Gelidibacter sediminis TaxID=1608710 RepID=A0A4V3F956_9FLAO|nr:hypothetical protein BXY82_0471 [Gelidibacter sediminis]